MKQSSTNHPHPVDRLATYYSSFYKLCKAVAWLMRFKRFLQTKEIEQGHLSSSELSRSRDAIVKVVQQSSYPEELHDIASKGCVSRSSRILKLSPMIADGILVVGGRLLHSALSCKRPPILPRDHPISRLIVRECHRASHVGTEWTWSNLRMRYWIVGARNVIKQVRRQCMVCKRLYAAILDQRMADLPPERCLTGGTPFDVTGTDLFGPILVKVNPGQVKRWGCIFTCFKSRAIHFEVLSSLEADSFINGFIRFVSRRGCPSKIYNDNGTNFVGAQAEIARCHRQLDKAKVRSAARGRGVDWEFNTPLSSHHGGMLERLIRSILKILLALFLPHMTLTDEVLHTVLCECECIINGRPITKSSDDVNDWEALTPNHLLAMRGVASLPWGNFDTVPEAMAVRTVHGNLVLEEMDTWILATFTVPTEVVPGEAQRRCWRLSAHRGWGNAERTVALRHRGRDQAWSGRPGTQCDDSYKDLTVQEAYHQTGPFGRESSV